MLQASIKPKRRSQVNKHKKWLIIPDIDALDESAALAEKHGAAFEYNDFFQPDVYTSDEEVERRIEIYKSLPRDRSADTLHGAFLDIAFASTDKIIRERSRKLIEQSVEIAERLGIRGVIFHTGIIANLNYGIYREAWLRAAEDTFRPLCKKYPSVEIYIENTFERSPDVFLALMQRMSDIPSFGLCLDYAHAVLTPTSPKSWIKTLAPYIKHIHLNDNDLKKDLHLVPGEGEIDYLRFYSLITEYGVDAPILLELKGIENQKKALAFMEGPMSLKPNSHTPNDLETVLEIAISLSKETDKTAILNTILTESMRIAGCDAGTLYILHEDGLHFSIMKTLSQNIDQGSHGEEIGLPPVAIRKENISAYTVLTKQSVRIGDVYETELFDFSGPKNYDKLTGYHTGSMLAVPLLNAEDEVIGVIQLINALDQSGNICPFSDDAERIIFALCSLAATTLSNIQYMIEMREQMWSFTEAMAEAIDKRTPYNANHIRNVANYASLVADYINKLHSEGATAEYFDAKRKDCLVMGALLHDIGKLVIPLGVMNKATRLGNLEAPLQHRFELLACKYQILHLKALLTDTEYAAKAEELEHIKSLVAKANTAGFLTDDTLAELQHAFKLKYDYEGEIIPYFTNAEQTLLSVRKGTLTAEERDIMESHVVATEKILEKVHFNSYFKNSPIFASQHHEFLNGKGYPRHLTADALPLESRILAAADIFDALLATDRPYKKPMPREKAIAIIYDMANCGQLDETVCRYLDAATAPNS